MSNDYSWALSMHQIESCSCSHGCGCQFGGFPDSANGGCEAILGFQVIKGHFNDLDLSGCKMVFVAMWPKAMHDGNGKGALFIDRSASTEQVTALATIMSGQAGGMPVEAIASLFTEFEGPIISDIVMDPQDHTSTVSISGVLATGQTPHINPVTGLENKVHITYPEGGFMWNDGFIGKTTELKVNHGNLAFDYKDTFAAKAIVNWPNA
ncbi:DUF1326 domain-containing protein [Thalassomonas sp. M1454]|uniref:DUF1326 domain-containing protein n=1 Tax=Thalassomonas sp. M1454 TaxID=2594477 RepID=UPI00117F8CA9|nr:DUF1326 domain-containing protein [Thalassomonas sp. M1454]TRX53859.1 DUF1326 domain-containing protein [Thalassomonas sp. M1454]